MRVDVLTLFPEWFDWLRRPRHLANAVAVSGLDIRCFSPRDHTPLGQGQVDDAPYGGGPGMVLRVDVIAAALEAVYGVPAGQVRDGRRVVVLSPRGRPFTDAVARELAALPALTLLCGRYEGFDERVHEHLANDCISLGPFVLAGGGSGRHGDDRRPGPAPARSPRQRPEPRSGVILAGSRRAR